jgi:hypothetical protein
MRKFSLLYVSLAASVAACSSGGGGGGGSAGVAAAPAVAAPQNVQPFTSFNGAAAPASVSGQAFNCGAAACAPSSVVGSGSSGSTVTLATTAGGDHTLSLNIASGGANFQQTFDFGPGDVNVTDLAPDNGAPAGSGFDGLADVKNGGDDVKFAGSARPNALNNLQYATFGLWSRDNGDGSGSYGTFAAGNETPVAGIPTGNVTADYSGTMVGEGSLNGNALNMTGAMTAHADFAARTVSGNMTVNVFADVAGAPNGFWNTLNFNSLYAAGSNHFAGTVAAPAVAGTAVATDAMSGALSGAFYGPGGAGGPQEIAGAFNAANAGGTNTLVGAFGAHR